MAKQHFEKFNGREVTDMMLAEASVLFSENYGIWGEDAAKTSPSTKPGRFVWPDQLCLNDLTGHRESRKAQYR